jgi:hypothetical protein
MSEKNTGPLAESLHSLYLSEREREREREREVVGAAVAKSEGWAQNT